MLSTLPPDLQTFLLLIATTPGILASQLDNWIWFKSLSPIQKLGFQIVISGLAAAILTLLASTAIPPETLKTANGVYVLIVQIITAILANQASHLIANRFIKPIGAAQEAKAIKSGPQG